jgi:Fic family protein
VDLIKEVHLLLTAGTYDEDRYIKNEERPGSFKKHDYITGLYEVGSPAEFVEDELEELIEETSSFAKLDILGTSTYFHARFEFIHPFADGNGRTGRTLLNYLLLIHEHPPIVIYDEDRRSYYDALRAYDSDEDIEPLKTFLVNQTVKTWEKSLLQSDTPTPRKKDLKTLLL